MENASKALIIAGAILIAILLISIGIILINSGRDVTSTGTAGMNSQKIQTFNSQFTVYEGTRKGSEVKSLINVVNASNATDSEHQVRVWGPELKAGDLEDTKTYTVSLFYSEYNGAVYPPTDWRVNWKAMNLLGINPQSEKGYISHILIADE